MTGTRKTPIHGTAMHGRVTDKRRTGFVKMMASASAARPSTAGAAARARAVLSIRVGSVRTGPARSA